MQKTEQHSSEQHTPEKPSGQQAPRRRASEQQSPEKQTSTAAGQALTGHAEGQAGQDAAEKNTVSGPEKSTENTKNQVSQAGKNTGAGDAPGDASQAAPQDTVKTTPDGMPNDTSEDTSKNGTSVQKGASGTHGPDGKHSEAGSPGNAGGSDGSGSSGKKGGDGSDDEPLFLPEKSDAAPPDLSHGKGLARRPFFGLILSQKRWHRVYVGVRDELWSKSLARRLIFCTVFLPGVLIFLYLMFWASSIYISDAKFAVRGQNTTPATEGFSFLFSIPSTTQNDSYIVLNYIQSLDMFMKLDEKLHLKEHYSDLKHDIWFRLSKEARQDDIRDFWEWACEATYDPDTSILEISVKAFTPRMALDICEEILRNSEDLVNEMNVRSRQDAVYKAQIEVERSEERIRQARAAMQTYRENTVILDPQAVASGLYEVVNRLESDVTRVTAELSEARTFMNRDSPRVKQLESRLAVLQDQLKEEKKRLAGRVQGDQSLSALMSTFQNLALEEEFAQKQLTSAMASLEAARVQADAQSEYIEAFARPFLADESLYPRPVLFTLLYMVVALLVLGLVSLIIAAVREHAGF